ncbi:hypothetical protein Trydic_g13297 [Trypoxylus dichotomus]
MRTVTDRQRNVSMQIKNGLKELEEALDTMAFYRDSWRKGEREVKVPEDEKPLRNVGENLIAPTPAGQEREIRKSENLFVDESLEIPWKEVYRNRRKQYRKDEAKRRAVERESRQQTSTTWAVAPLNCNNKKLNPKTARPKHASLFIKPAQGKTYAEVLSEIRQRVKSKEAEVNINAVQQTKRSGILIEPGRNSINCEGFTNQFQEALREKAQVSTLQAKVTLKLRDLDYSRGSE